MTTDPMPVFVIKAKDRLAFDAIDAYANLCLDAGLVAQAQEASLAAEEVMNWQARNPTAVQWPDHRHVPATADASDAAVTR